ncbi:hypothetical protein CH298_15005 [Rhodococcoides fascians]|uniref:hypothetical protein n=1 Tax=Rhodococcoides fascians TaxID=1828 RepID=UPI000B9BADE3|nr:hypothetical protein [Rhodococcus fascians]OZE88590.1 hypothetical protein CH303_14885 [Rhodococcus fascians]OZF16551.1 hypothetical protein CH298_15005 [Rhodococcus fascians]OZF19567.1 hypothetical protein CH297_14900 [Rhodococcus fascians]OZF65833.1 hypothetical protein CH308_14805 [Rhodococcus fascians]OZF68984.1 hypothetical protein CH307_15000 [Rhodococcus fascians]
MVIRSTEISSSGRSFAADRVDLNLIADALGIDGSRGGTMLEAIVGFINSQLFWFSWSTGSYHPIIL